MIWLAVLAAWALGLLLLVALGKSASKPAPHFDRTDRRRPRPRIMASPAPSSQSPWQVLRQLVGELVVAAFSFVAICYVVFVAAPVLAQRLGL